MDIKLAYLHEAVIEGKRLGRHVEHDPRSRAFAIVMPHAITIDDLRNVRHRRFGGPLDQGHLGSCTGNAVAGCVNTLPIHRSREHLLKEDDAVQIYSLATKLDEFEGVYPPTDSGSSGLAAAKAAQNMGLISGYQHAFSLEQALVALMEKPIITGVNWYEGFDNPDHHGHVEIAGQVRGGHEFEILGFEKNGTIEDSYVEAENSWGSGWGLHGRFRFKVSTWKQLLAEDGDATVLIP